MAKQKRLFRNAWGGFRKKDVVAYIEKTSAEHRAELLEKEQTITALQEANHSLQQQLNILMMSTPAPAPGPNTGLIIGIVVAVVVVCAVVAFVLIKKRKG